MNGESAPADAINTMFTSVLAVRVELFTKSDATECGVAIACTIYSYYTSAIPNTLTRNQAFTGT